MKFYDFITLAFSFIAIIFSIITFIQNVIHDKRADTLNAFNILQEQCFDKLNLFSPSEIKEICKNRKSDKYKILSGYLARLEHFCVGVNNGIYDKKTVYELAHGYLDSDVIFERMSPIIQTKNTNEDYFKNTHKLLDYMKKMTTCSGFN